MEYFTLILQFARIENKQTKIGNEEYNYSNKFW